MVMQRVVISIVSILFIVCSKEIKWVTASKNLKANDNQKLPNILMIIADDLGWGNVGFHNSQNDEISTPYIDGLVRNGLELYRFKSA